MKLKVNKADLKKVAHNWSWWGAPIYLTVGLFFGWLGGLYLGGWRRVANALLDKYGHEAWVLLLIAFLLARLVAVVKWPRITPIDYNKINWPGVFAANFISIIIGVMLIIATLAFVAPGVLEMLAKHFGG